jgi:hypothetical protein
MTTLEKIEKQDFPLVGTEPQPEFIVSSKAYRASNASFSLKIQDLFNENLSISNYSVSKIKHLSFIFIILPSDWNGVQRPERKYYKNKECKLYVDLHISNYQQFIDAKPQEALKLMATETLRGAKKFLSGVKDFNFERFYADVEDLFKRQGWV